VREDHTKNKFLCLYAIINLFAVTHSNPALHPFVFDKMLYDFFFETQIQKRKEKWK